MMARKLIAILLIPLSAAFAMDLVLPKAGCACVDAAVYSDGTVVWLTDQTTVKPDGSIQLKNGEPFKPTYWQRFYYRSYFKQPNRWITGEAHESGKKALP